MQITNTYGACSVADRIPDMVETKNSVCAKIITAKRRNGGSYEILITYTNNSHLKSTISRRGLYGYSSLNIHHIEKVFHVQSAVVTACTAHFNVRKHNSSHILCIYVFRVNGDSFPKQH
jgi:hypothetical protein